MPSMRWSSSQTHSLASLSVSHHSSYFTHCTADCKSAPIRTVIGRLQFFHSFQSTLIIDIIRGSISDALTTARDTVHIIPVANDIPAEKRGRRLEACREIRFANRIVCAMPVSSAISHNRYYQYYSNFLLWSLTRASFSVYSILVLFQKRSSR